MLLVGRRRGRHGARDRAWASPRSADRAQGWSASRCSARSALAAALTRPTATAARRAARGDRARSREPRRSSRCIAVSPPSPRPRPRSGSTGDRPFPDGVDRRRFLVSSGVAFGVAAAAGAFGQFFSRRPAGRRVSRGGTLPGPGRPGPAASGRRGLQPRRPEPVLHAERRVLSRRHRPDRAVGARRGLEPARARHGRRTSSRSTSSSSWRGR